MTIQNSNAVTLRPRQEFLDQIAGSIKILPGSEEARVAIGKSLANKGYVLMPVGPGYYARKDGELTRKIMRDNPTRLGVWEARVTNSESTPHNVPDEMLNEISDIFVYD